MPEPFGERDTRPRHAYTHHPKNKDTKERNQKEQKDKTKRGEIEKAKKRKFNDYSSAFITHIYQTVLYFVVYTT